ncbi:transmembrane protein, putative (macronuclear) [Tetrahymena thermophila SB210]|uniref:Transmembrane protein, putative n=1 Tax=Tetrahymena thermophila (strain SB210) TaxID=312017 RepID=Q22HJ4_TETTS|nr:transmembrane protein, putative [Tetrahymena thermophila SB210]EAR84707.1 transmembrane protein, putative [Tetrahymena thermophila SB210]|eukprot:XP_001032370.1 transmembrane protein, putative [Tetrahymena thermophila SB210]
MVTKVFATTLISLLLITGAVYYFSQSKSMLNDFHGNLTPTEHMLCKAQQFQQNDYTCIDSFRDMECQQHYYSFLSQYRQNETKFYEIYKRQPEDVKYVVDGWNKSCNTFEHYRRCGDAEYLFTHCVFSGQVSDCSIENREYIEAAWECSNVPDGIPFWNVDLYSANCMTGIVHLAKGSLAEALACK